MASYNATHSSLAKHAEQSSLSQRFFALPQPLLELILLQGTSTKDKQSLRHTCKRIQELLDNNLTCIVLRPGERGWSPDRFLERMQHVHSLKAAAVESYFHMGKMLRLLPGHLATLIIVGWNINLKDVGRLPCLTALYIDDIEAKTTGLEYVSGLTRLWSSKPVGPLAHLAPTLRHLSASRFNAVPDLKHLTNLQELDLDAGLPANFFQQHGHLPLKHLRLSPSNSPAFFNNPKAWEACPPTLTNLTLQHQFKVLSGMQLPASITRVQLLFPAIDGVSQMAAALPGLMCLDVFFNPYNTRVSFGSLNKLTNLRSLGVGVIVDGIYWHRDQILSELPEVAKAVQDAVTLNCVTDKREFYSMFWDPCYALKSAEWRNQG